MTNNLTRQIARTLYMLKRQYGGEISLYRLLSTDTDPRTGKTTEQRETIVVRRAVILPLDVQREVERSISQISANKQLVMGGFFDVGTRLFLVDQKDVPSDFAVTPDGWVVFKGDKYAIEDFTRLEFDAGWMVVGRKLLGEQPQQTFILSAYNILGLEQSDGLS